MHNQVDAYERDQRVQIKAEIDRLGGLCIPDYKDIAAGVNTQFGRCLTPSEVKDIHRGGNTECGW